MPALLATLAAGFLVAGVVVFAVADGSGAPRDVGRTASTPLEPQVAYRSDLVLSFDDPWAVLWTGAHVAGALLVVTGLLLFAAAGDWELGRRSSART
ncbi:hypothetical protein [Blastococcus goldschmidtiae]|uniref:hypothetical protein n=1 Tax=Blastococcus goldschmidtiae TaxID=3075546 RepID=UPI00288C5503|nr:hypothetical protein [Blastococcus sp. DSM 46792]